MFDGSKIITLLIIFLALIFFPVWYAHIGQGVGKAPEPQLTAKAKAAGKCIESKEFMKTQHMKMLDRWRNDAVRDGNRYYTASDGKTYYTSLQATCLNCHSNRSKFCDQCHNYVGVDPFCWECHFAPKEYK